MWKFSNAEMNKGLSWNVVDYLLQLILLIDQLFGPSHFESSMMSSLEFSPKNKDNNNNNNHDNKAYLKIFSLLS